jgi:hypothetical protein
MILMLQDARVSVVKTPSAEIVKCEVQDIEVPPSLVKDPWACNKEKKVDLPRAAPAKCAVVH